VGRTPLEADGKLRNGVLIGTTKGARSGVIQPDAVARRGSPLEQRLENVDEAIGPTSEWKANASPAP